MHKQKKEKNCCKINPIFFNMERSHTTRSFGCSKGTQIYIFVAKIINKHISRYILYRTPVRKMLFRLLIWEEHNLKRKKIYDNKAFIRNYLFQTYFRYQLATRKSLLTGFQFFVSWIFNININIKYLFNDLKIAEINMEILRKILILIKVNWETLFHR